MKGSRSIYNYYMWIFKPTTSVILMNKESIKKINKYKMGRMSNMMLEHCSQHIAYECEISHGENFNYTLECQVKQIQENLIGSHRKIEVGKLKCTI